MKADGRLVAFTPDQGCGLAGPVRPLIERCLAKDPGDRPTAGELLAELSETALTEDWLPEQIVRNLPRYAVSDSDPGGTSDAGGSPGQGASESSPAPDVPDVPPTVTSVSASPGLGQILSPPLPGGVPRNRQRRGRRRLALASVAVILAASAAAAIALVSSPAAGHLRTTAGSATAASSALAASQAAASRGVNAAASRPASASPDRSPSKRASQSAKATTAARTPQANPGNAPSVPAVPTPGVLTSVSSAYAPQGGNVFVTYQDGADSSAQVSGQVTNAVSGEVAKLYAQQFPFTSPRALAGSAAAT